MAVAKFVYILLNTSTKVNQPRVMWYTEDMAGGIGVFVEIVTNYRFIELAKYMFRK
jgi:hypothetical protein